MSANRPSPTPAAVHGEILKLLLQVAWADGEVASEESASLLAYARRVGLPPAELQRLESCLRGQAPLPPPNLGLLRQHRVEVMRRVRELLQSDLKVTSEEDEVLTEIAVLLGSR